MILSINWLKTMVDIDVNADNIRDFADKMTMSGSKVESYEIEAETLKNIVVGKIVSLEKHPDADKLLVCQIDIGKEENIQIVTGAFNMKENDLIPVALHKSVIADGTKITKGKLRGVVSEGMLCSLAELGLTTNDFPYALEDGIFVLEEENIVVGECIKKALHLNDISVDFEITSNRNDCNSVIGLAREVAATYKKPMIIKTLELKENQNTINEYLSVNVLNPELCSRYIAKVVKNVKIEPSPKWLRERLRNSGVRPINNLVDITNYVMLEYGQPMHAFDYNHIDGKEIIVRTANDDKKMTTLDDKEITLDENILLITDKTKPIGIAGVMGGKDSEIMGTTKTVVFESAHFDYSSIRQTIKKTAISSDASSRFAKNIDSNITLPAVLRACELVELLNAGEVVAGIIDIDNSKYNPVEIKIDYDWINSFIGIDLSIDQMNEILTNLDFKVEKGILIVPSHRKDVKHNADLSEEIARFYGYDKIGSTVMRGVANAQFTKEQIFETKVKNNLVASGGNEIITYSFISPKEYDKILLLENDERRNSVTISNPLGEDTSIMRTTAIPSMLNILSKNYNNRNLEFSAFEIATEYIKIENEQLPDENKKIIIGMYGEDTDFFVIKGYVDSLMSKFKIDNYEIIAETDNHFFHPGKCAKLIINDTIIGYLGEVYPIITSNYDIKTKVYLADLDLKKLYENINFDIEFTPLPKYPSTGRDLALVVDKSLPMLDIKNILSKHFKDILENIYLFDVYEGENIADDKKSLAFHIHMRSKDGTLTDDDVNKRISNAIDELKTMDIHLRS